MIQKIKINTSASTRRAILKDLLLHEDMLKLNNSELCTKFNCVTEDVQKARVKVNILKTEKFGKGVQRILMWLYEKEDINHNPFSERRSFC
jgi:hypothetical protein